MSNQTFAIENNCQSTVRFLFLLLCLLGLVLSKGLALTVGGLVLGLVVARQVTRLLGYLLYKVSPRDPIAFGSAFVVITVASLVACFVPAWRATRTDPLRALRG